MALVQKDGIVDAMNATNEDGTFKDLESLNSIEETTRKKDKTKDVDHFFQEVQIKESKRYRTCRLCK